MTNFAETFWGESGFEALRKHIKISGEFFKEIINVLEERAEIEANYSKSLQKLSAKLVKVAKPAIASIDNAWKFVADELEGEGTVHRNFAIAIETEIVKPLKSVFEAQQKTRKSVESEADKGLKKYFDTRTEQTKYKKKSHGLAQNSEKIEQTCAEEKRRSIRLRTEKQLSKLREKCSKLKESSHKADANYRDSTISAEKQRQILENNLSSSAVQFQTMEQARLANLQMALGRYRCHLAQLGPNITQNAIQKLDKNIQQSVLIADTRQDMQTIVTHCQPSDSAFRNLILCDFYAEDFSNKMDHDRRQGALNRFITMFEECINKEGKEKKGLETLAAVYDKNAKFTNPESTANVHGKIRDTSLMLSFLDYHLHKLRCCTAALCTKVTSTGSLPKPGHELARYEDIFKDKLGYRQTVLRLPLPEAGFTMTNVDHEEKVTPYEERSAADGQSPSRVSDTYDTENVYEQLNNEAPESSVQYGSISNLDCKAIYDYVPQEENRLNIKTGDIIRIKSKYSKDWWEGELDGKEGFFPSSYVEEL